MLAPSSPGRRARPGRGRLRARRGGGLLLLACVLGACSQVPLDNRAPRLISARGTGRVAAKPDIAVVRIGAEMRAPTVAEATADVARRSAAIVERAKALGVAERDITTVAYSIEPLPAPRRTDDDPTRIVAYRVLNVVQVKIRDLGATARIVDGALTAGANTISGLQFTVDDPSRAEAEARTLAVKEATATARQLAAAAGVGLGELMSLSEDAVARPVMARMAASPGAAAPLSMGPVESGQIEIVINVEAHYRIDK